jgi:mannose-1-phosphate guanylyltransferase/mannose-6-phosphate isomerase
VSIYPVIMCGGSGTRLWPASRPERPKQFIPLIGDLSSFQNTVVRVGGITGATAPLVIAGVRHRSAIEAQLAELGVEAVLLLEPEARDSAAAMAAAAAWIARQDAEGVAVFVSADHEVPDSAAFRTAASTAAEAAKGGRIVTLGVRPRSPSTAFGYIRPEPGETQVRPVAAFVEKPDATRAAAYVEQGYLWNSGNFVTAATTLLAELDAFAPGVAQAAREAVAGARRDGMAVTLGPAFKTAPKISIDYAVMEKTARASVLPVEFSWADIGAWDAVLAASPADASGNHHSGHVLMIDSENCLVRAPQDMQVAIVGARNLAVVVEDGAVLVSDLSRCQGVKQAGDHFGSARSDAFTDLTQARDWYRQWLWARALPLWSTLGLDSEGGGWRESLAADGAAVEPSRRARVAARQTYVYASAGAAGWPGPWRQAMRHGLAALDKDF